MFGAAKCTKDGITSAIAWYSAGSSPGNPAIKFHSTRIPSSASPRPAICWGVTLRVSLADFFSFPNEIVAFAEHADELGFERFWVGEHHTRSQCANPLLLAAVLAGLTQSIRIGTGATLLSSRGAIAVAEDARILSQLYGDRIDVGVTGGWSPLFAAACSELAGLLRLDAPSEANMPHTSSTPAPWLMVTRPEAAVHAGELGLGMCASFHHGGTRNGVRGLIDRYRGAFRPGSHAAPHSIVMISGVCAENEAALEDARASYAEATSRLAGAASTHRSVSFDGIPSTVTDLALAEAATVGADEVMLLFLEPRPDGVARLSPVIAEIAAHAGLVRR